MRLAILMALVCIGAGPATRDDPRDAEIRMLRNSAQRNADLVAPLKAQLKEQEQRIAQLQADIRERDKRIAALSADMRKLADEIERMKAERVAAVRQEAAAKNKTKLEVLPVLGDETSLAAVAADPLAFLNKPVIAAGGARVQNYFNYEFKGHDLNLYSIDFTQYDKNLNGGRNVTAYAPRAVAKPLMDRLTKAQADTMTAVRFKLTVTPRCMPEGEWHDQLELIDWQFLNAERTAWEPWGHCNTDRISHHHRGGGFYASIDGSVHWFKEPMNLDSWAWFSRAGSGNMVSLGNVPNPGWGWWNAQ